MRTYWQIFISIPITLLTVGLCYSAGPNILTVNAVVLSKSNCNFNAAAAALNFGSLDPANPVDKTVTTSITFVCRGSAPLATFSITDNDGLYANRMRHTTVLTEYLPYSLTYNPQTDTVPKNATQTLTISGTVLGNDFQDAYAGAYSDTVILTLSP